MKRSTGTLPLLAAGATTLLLCGAFSWRAVVSWQRVAQSEPKLFAAILLSVMLTASCLTLGVLVRDVLSMKQESFR